jgi:hypothetical protein
MQPQLMSLGRMKAWHSFLFQWHVQPSFCSCLRIQACRKGIYPWSLVSISVVSIALLLFVLDATSINVGSIGTGDSQARAIDVLALDVLAHIKFCDETERSIQAHVSTILTFLILYNVALMSAKRSQKSQHHAPLLTRCTNRYRVYT